MKYVTIETFQMTKLLSYARLALIGVLTIFAFFEAAKIANGIHLTYTTIEWLRFGALAVIVIALLVIGRVLRLNSMIPLLCTPILLISHTFGILPVATTALILLSAAILGTFVMHFLNLKTGVAKAPFTLAIALGLGILSTIIGWIAPYQINTFNVYLAILLTPLLGLPFLNSGAKGFLESTKDTLKKATFNQSRFSLSEMLPWTLLALSFSIATAHSLKPEMGYDALSYHLPAPLFLVQNGYWPFNVESFVWAVQPFSGDWLYALAIMLHAETAARVLNLALGGLSLCVLFHCCMTATKDRTLSMWLTALFVTTPLFHSLSATLFVDHFVAFLLFASLWPAIAADSKNLNRHFILSAIFLGFSLTAKATMFIWTASCSILWMGIYIAYRRRPIILVKYASISVIIISIIALPVYLRAYIRTGNPVFPYFNRFFQSEFFETSTSFSNQLWKTDWSFSLLYRLTFESGRFLESDAGAAGFYLFAFFPLTLVAKLPREKAKYLLILLTSVLFFFGVFRFQAYLRYLYPFFGLSLVILAHLFSANFQTPYLRKSALALVASICALNTFFIPSGSHILRGFDPFLGKEERSAWANVATPERNLIEFINESAGSSSVTLVLPRPFIAGLQGKVFSNSWHSPKLQADLLKLQSEDDVKKFLTKWNVSHFIAHENWERTPPALRRYLESKTPIAENHSFKVYRETR